MKNGMIPMAIAYDFDGTLAPGNMQEYDFVPSIGMNPKEFWDEAIELERTHQADESHARERTSQLISEGRVNAIAPAIYSEGSEIEKMVMAMIDKVVAVNALNQLNDS